MPHPGDPTVLEHPPVSQRYQIERELGRGGMAVVYLARDRKHDRPVAIKLVRPEIMLGQAAERFLLEIRILSRLQHPNILALLDSGATDEPSPRPYYVMPFIEGETLRQRLAREGPLPMADALRLAREIGEALHYAHENGLIHRDVKPENVLLSQGHALVADFGIARAAGVAAGDRLTKTGLGLGTPAYMSPEQAGGERGVDARADQYSLACLVYELLAGQPPFTGPDAIAVLSRQLLDPVPPLTTLRPTVPVSVRRAIEQALAKVPVDRYESVMEFLAALEAPDRRRRRADHEAGDRGAPVRQPEPRSRQCVLRRWADGGGDRRPLPGPVAHRDLPHFLRQAQGDRLGPPPDRAGAQRRLRARGECPAGRLGAPDHGAADRPRHRDRSLGREVLRHVDDVFDLQERLSRQIVEALRITLSPPEDREIAQRPIADIRAFEYYQRARQEYYRHSAEGMLAARALAEHGLAVVGPNEALYGMLGTVYAWAPTFLGEEEETTLREAEECARRAFELNPESAQGLSIMGQVAYRRGHAGEAVRLLTRACAADPNNPDAMHQLAGAYLLGGRVGPMQDVLNRLVELDPLTASNHCLLGLSYSFAGDPASALPSHRRAVELDPRSTICRVCAAVALTAAGRDTEASDQFDWLERQPADDHLAAVGIRFRRGLVGDRAGVLSPLSQAERATAESDEYWAYLTAAAYASVGEDDRALDWLEHTVDVRGWVDYVYFTRHDRFLARVRQSRRFQALMARARERHARFTDDGTPTRPVG